MHEHGGTVLLVGGAVRDLLLHASIHDLDCEVYGIKPEMVQHILSQCGNVRLVGSSFGVYKIDRLAIDWSLPRSDSAGRKPTVHIDPYMSYKDAFARRDLTINAMGIDLHSKKLIDPYNGYSDLQNKILRAPDLHKFVEDPLRLYRVMQFIGRFEDTVDPALHNVCKTMDISHVSRERIEQEFEKLLLKSRRPSLGIRWLAKLGRLQEILPDLYGTIGIPQRPDFHPEGDVFEHTMQALDAAAYIAQSYENQKKKLILLYAALCHDLGKQDVTVWKDDRWRSTGHAQAGIARTKSLLKCITNKKSIIDTAALLVEYHMEPGIYAKENAGIAAYKKLAYKLSPKANSRFLADLASADRRGRNAESHEPLTIDDEHVLQFIQKAKEVGVLYEPEPPLLSAQDFIDLGMQPGPHIGKLLDRAYELQLRHSIQDKEVLKEWMLKDIKNNY
jgi:tRNA nucleotidyltransferase (CCA-adding enzyme)